MNMDGCGKIMALSKEPTREESDYSRRIAAISTTLREALAPGVLIFLSGQASDKLQQVFETLGEKVSFISVGNFLSRELLEVTRSRRSQKACQLLGEKTAVGPCCLYDLEILFDPDMKLDVLTSLKTLAKGRELYVDWPGEWKAEEQCLTFAEPEDPAYRAYPVDAEIGVVDLSGETYPALEF